MRGAFSMGTIDEVSINITYRWALGHKLLKKMQYFFTVNYIFQSRFMEELLI